MQNRIIKFRAWQTTHETFIPLEDDGDYFFIDQGDGLELHNKYGRCKNIVLLQFTGLKDKNGKDIYEGDILRDPEGIGVVYFYPPQFIVQTENIPYQLAKGEVNVEQLSETEIIGNIHENPELLTNPMANK